MTDNRTTELRISEPLRGFIRHQSNRAYIDSGQASWLTKIADEIDAKHEQAVDDARIVEVTTSHIDIEQGEVITRFVPEQAIAVTLGSKRYPYEQRIVGDGSDWGEIMIGAYDDLIAAACESCTPEQIRKLADYIRAELGSERTCRREKHGTKMDGSPKLRCSLCGYGIGDKRWSYCPNCGARVMSE